MITEESFHKRNGILVTTIAYYGNNQAIPIIGNIVILANCIITHHKNTFTHYMNLLYARHNISPIVTI